MKRLKIGALILIGTIFLLVGGRSILSADVTVNSVEELKTALQNNDNIKIGSDFTVSETVQIPNSYNKTIDGSNHKLTLGSNLISMFRIDGDGADVKFDKIHFDGNNQGRFLRLSGAGKTLFTNSTFENGVSYNENTNYLGGDYHGGAIYAINGATVNIESSTFKNNRAIPKLTGTQVVAHGGAIYVRLGVTLNISKNTVFENNSVVGLGDSIGNGGGGGAVYVEDAKSVDVANSTFTKNHNGHITSSGNQGGAIRVRSTPFTSTNNTYDVGKTFNTGGAIYVYGTTAKINGDTFKIDNLGDVFGISGGFIASENNNLEVTNSNFSTTYGSKVTYAGGFIDVVGSGSMTIKKSTLTGPGSWWRSTSSATYGGAIAFETGSSATGLIEDTTIRNFGADATGGAITISTKKGEASSVNLTLRNTTIDNTRASYGHGGGIYVGPGNTLKVEGGNLRNSFANYGGGIYNDGTTTISGANTTNVNNNTAYYYGGGIFNNGVLTVDTANLNGNFKVDGYGGRDQNLGKLKEYAGGNIYAQKDVTITPKATFDSGDVRVLDEESAIILTGELTKNINVTVSETPGGSNNEKPKRYIGYMVAKGDGTYTPTEKDANTLHYYTRENDASSVNDFTSTAKWDYVLNPENNTVVLGQRGKLVYHTNKEDAVFADGVNAEADTEGAGKKLEQLYTFYSSGDGGVKSTPTELTAGASAKLANSVFKGWYQPEAKGHPIYNEETDKTIYKDFAVNKFSTRANVSGRVEAIMNADIENTLHAYAAYERETIKVKVKKDWGSSIHKSSVTFALKDGDKTLEEISVSETDTNFVEFKEVPKFKEERQEINYKVEEKNVVGDVIKIGDYTYKVSVSDITGQDTNTETNVKYYKVTNEEENEVTFAVEKVWVNGPSEKPEITLILQQDNKPYEGEGAEKKLPSGTTTAKWEKLPKYKQDGTLYKYSVKENTVENYNTTYSEEGTKVNNTYVVPKTEYTVNKVWSGGKDERPTIKVQLYKQVEGTETKEKVGSEVELVNGTTTYKWSDLDKTTQDGKDINYSADEVEVPENYTKEVKGNTITNTYVVPKTSYTVEKVWRGRRTERPTIKVQLYKQVEGAETKEKAGDEVELKDGATTYTWTDLDKTTQDGKDIIYSVDEVEVPEGFKKTIEGNKIINDSVRTSRFVAIKDWNDGLDYNADRPEVEFELYFNDELKDKIKLNKENRWRVEFNPLTKYGIENGSSGLTVKEAGVKEEEDEYNYAGRVTIDGKKYRVSRIFESASDFMEEATSYTIVNHRLIDIQVEKQWFKADGTKDNDINQEVKVELIRDGSETGKELKLDKANNWKSTFEDLDKAEYSYGRMSTTDYEYEIRESGVVDGKIKVGDKEYLSEVKKTEEGKYIITNTELKEVETNHPEKPTEEKTSLTVEKQWLKADGTKDVDINQEIEVELLKNEEATGQKVKLNKGNGWKSEFSKLAVTENDAKVYYSVKESGAVDGKIKVGDKEYLSEVKKTEEGKYIITNMELKEGKTTTPEKPTEGKTSITVEKQWLKADGTKDADINQEIEVELLKNGGATGQKVKLNKDNGWKSEFSRLAATENDAKIDYSVKESGVDDGKIKVGDKEYLSETKKTEEGKYVITNMELKEKEEVTPTPPLEEKTKNIKVEKQWVGDKKEDEVVINLIKNNTEVVQTLKLNKNNNWKGEFVNLPEKTNNQRNVYSVKEVGENSGKLKVADNEYEVIIEGSGESFVVKNIYIESTTPPTPDKPEDPKINTKNIKVEKQWVGEKREDEVQIELVKDGKEVVQVVTLNKENNWRTEFSNLPIDKGQVYSVRELGEEGGKVKFGDNSYKVQIKGNENNGYVITNIYEEPKPVEPPKPIEPPKPDVPTPPIPEKPEVPGGKEEPRVIPPKGSEEIQEQKVEKTLRKLADTGEGVTSTTAIGLTLLALAGILKRKFKN